VLAHVGSGGVICIFGGLSTCYSFNLTLTGCRCGGQDRKRVDDSWSVGHEGVNGFCALSKHRPEGGAAAFKQVVLRDQGAAVSRVYCRSRGSNFVERIVPVDEQTRRTGGLDTWLSPDLFGGGYGDSWPVYLSRAILRFLHAYSVC
jgi:hypothetical protein